MAGLKRYTGNRQEILAAQLAECIRTPLSSPLAPEIIIVQSKGMERWLSMELARHHGVCANIRFPFPNAFLDELFRLILPEYREAPPYDPEVMAWQILHVLPSCLQNPEFADLRRYLQDDAGGLKGYQLAGRLADLFDQYLVFRPDMILDWEAGASACDGDIWQAELWRRIRRDYPGEHPARLRQRLRDRLRKPLPAPSPLPERLSVFGVSWLPLFHLEVLHDLSRHMDIHLFLLNPCREFWTDIRSEREMGRTVEKIRESRGIPMLSAADLYLEGGNPLLASMGTQGRDFFRWIMDLPGEEYDFFDDPGEATLLRSIQSDILNLRERGRDGEAKTLIDPRRDHSFRIHSCHSPMREVEALHDQLLALFDDDPELLPRDIMVMAPDMAVYAPLIQAVFDTPSASFPGSGAVPRIPFTIADRSLSGENPIIDAFLKLLELLGSRFEASSVLALLETPPVRDKFGLSEEEMERIRRWIIGTRIRWGMDGEARGREGLPGFPENTWRAGLERLFLGYALPGRDEQLFNGLLPYDDIEGLEAQTLGVLAEYLEALFTGATLLDRSRTPGEWAATLSLLLDRFFQGHEETQRDLLAVRQTIQRLEWLGERSGFAVPVSVDIVKAYLKRHFGEQGSGSGYINGSVTCCAMLPMRSLPFKVICLLGMNHDGYPRPSRVPGFDLMTGHPRPGDRSRRHDDRYLFLEALLSAREKLIISYIGQSIADNSLLPPSVLVSELLDTVEQGFTWPEGRIMDQLTIRHRLQAFHPAYFTSASNLFSYSEENNRAAECLCESRNETPPFLASPLSESGEHERVIDIVDMINFFRNPCRFLLERRLATSLAEDADLFTDQEEFDIRGLEKYNLEQRLVEKSLAGENLDALYPSFRAAGLLPHGNVGLNRYRSLLQETKKFAAGVEPYLRGTPLEPIDVRLDLAGFQVNGRIDNVYRDGLFHFRYADLKAKDYLTLWINHLVLNALSDGGNPLASALIGRDGAWTYRPVENAGGIFEGLLSIYWEGLALPSHFLPETSLRYAEQVLLKGKSPAEALRAARQIWTGSDYGRGESEDRYYQRCFSDRDPLNEAFQQRSILVFEPLFQHRTAL